MNAPTTRLSKETEAVLTFSFDDGFKETHESTLSWLMDYGLKASYNIITSLVGDTYMNLPTASWADWQDASMKGMEVASHSMTHSQIPVPLLQNLHILLESFFHERHKFNYFKHVARSIFSPQGDEDDRPETDLENISKEVIGSKEEIDRRLGQETLSYVYPHGAYTHGYQSAVQSAGYASARSTIRGLNRFGTQDLFALKIMLWDGYTTVKIANEWVDAAIRNNAWLIEVYHLVGSRKPSNWQVSFTSINHFREHLDYVRTLCERGKLCVDTQGNIVKRMHHGSLT